MNEAAIFKVIKYFGSQKNLAKFLSTSQQRVSYWFNNGKIPTLEALKIVIYSGGEIKLEELISEDEELTWLLSQVFSLKGGAISCLPINKIIKGNKKCPIYRDTNEHSFLTNDATHTARAVLVNDKNELITCECRLRGHKSNHARVKILRLNVFELLKGGSNIASLLHNFPMSERVEVGLFIEEELGDRRGRRTDLELPQNFAEVGAMGETRRIAAKIACFGNHRTYSQAKAVVKQAIPAVIQAMDAKVLSVSKAKQIAILPEGDQMRFIETMNKKRN